MSKRSRLQDILKLKKLIENRNTKAHFLGVGGVGMYSLFEILELKGIKSTGSDRSEGELFKILQKEKKSVKIGDCSEFINECDLLVHSHAISYDNKELRLASELDKEICTRDRLLGALVLDYEKAIGVCGTHGKSTVTAITHHIFKSLGMDSDCICGASLSKDGKPYEYNNSKTLIYEACEYKDSFLSFFPDFNIFLNLELDHTDYFSDIEALKASFLSAMNNCQVAIVNSDDENLISVSQRTEATVISIGQSKKADYRLVSYEKDNGFYKYEILERDGKKNNVKLGIPGFFNVYNSLCAYAACREWGLDGEGIAEAISSFPGIPRRLEYIGKYRGRAVYYDYAHHPREIAVGIETVEAITGQSPMVIFRPHTYSRTSAFFSDFVNSLSLAKRVLLLDIDGIREENKYGVTSLLLAEKMGEVATRVTNNDVFEHINSSNLPILLMGAADVSCIKEGLIKNGKEKLDY